MNEYINTIVSKGAKFISLGLLGSHFYYWFWICRNLLALMGMLTNPDHLADFCRIAGCVWWINTSWKCSVNRPVPEMGLCALDAHLWAKRTILQFSCWRLTASALLTAWCTPLCAIIIMSFLWCRISWFSCSGCNTNVINDNSNKWRN